jgi:hypothetical protein
VYSLCLGGLYFRLHHVHRPLDLKKNASRRRRRTDVLERPSFSLPLPWISDIQLAPITSCHVTSTIGHAVLPSVQNLFDVADGVISPVTSSMELDSTAESYGSLSPPSESFCQSPPVLFGATSMDMPVFVTTRKHFDTELPEAPSLPCRSYKDSIDAMLRAAETLASLSA